MSGQGEASLSELIFARGQAMANAVADWVELCECQSRSFALRSRPYTIEALFSRIKGVPPLLLFF